MVADMMSGTHKNNDHLTPDIDPEIQNTQSKTVSSSDQATMQAARKESSSGFMLLSVRHLSNVKNSVITNGRAINALEECYGDSCVTKATSMQINCKAQGGACFELGRNYSSTIALGIEEYENDDEEEQALKSQSKPHKVLQQNQLVDFKSQSFAKPSPKSNYDSTQINMEWRINDHQLGEEISPTTVPSIQMASAGLPVQTFATQPYDFHPVENCPRHPVLFRLNSDVASDSALESPIGHGLGFQIHYPELPAFKYSDPFIEVGLQSPDAAVADIPPQCQPDIPTTILQPPIRCFKEQDEEPLLSAPSVLPADPLLPPIDVPIQPMSRFRKARIHETIEQWDSNRLSFHDCRLKVVPDWISYLQNRHFDTSFDHPIAQRGRCLYCYVPGSLGLQCHNPEHKNGSLESVLKYQNTSPCSLLGFPDSSEFSPILQATIASYHSATQHGYNLSSLLTAWNAGERVANHALLERINRPLNNNSFGSVVNASEPAPSTKRVELVAHNSIDFNSHLSLGSEKFGMNDITSTRHSICHQPLTSVSKHSPPTHFFPPKMKVEKSAGAHITDPSSAYLRRQLSVGAMDTKVTHVDDGTPHPPPPTGLNMSSTAEQQIAPPASPTKPGKPPTVSPLLGTHVDSVDNADAFPRTVGCVRSSSGTTITSIQLSPDTEISEMAIPNFTDPSPTFHLAPSNALTQSRHTLPVFAFSDSTQSPLTGEMSHAQINNTAPGANPMPVDLSAAARNIFQVAAAACVNGDSKIASRPSNVASSTSISSNLEVQMPKCMHVIRSAIMETLQHQFSHLNSENEALRVTVNTLQHENHILQSYKQAFLDLRHFFQPEVWKQIEQQVRIVEAAGAVGVSNGSNDLQYYPPPPSQQNCAFQALPRNQSSSNRPPNIQYPIPPTSTVTNLPLPPSRPPLHTDPQ